MSVNAGTVAEPVQRVGSLNASIQELLKRQDGLFTDTCNFLDHKILAHMGMWAYLNGGRSHLEEFFQSKDYDGKREESLIPTIGAQFARVLPERISLIELGPGNAVATKTKAFIDSFNRATGGQKKIVEYHAIDIVGDYATDSADYISQQYHITSGRTVDDYTRMGPIDTLATPVLISWNTPIWNAPIARDVDPDFIYASNLKKIGQLIGGKHESKATAILTHFPLRDIGESMRIYSNEHNEKAVRAIANLVEKRLGPVCANVDADERIKFSDIFKYNVSIDQEGEYIDMELVSLMNAAVSIGDEYASAIDKGESFSAVRSAKPSIRRFHNIARMSNANIINTVQDTEGSVVAQALQFNAN